MTHPPELENRGTPNCRLERSILNFKALKWMATRKRVGEGTADQQCLPQQCFRLPGREHFQQTLWPAVSHSLLAMPRQ